MCLFLLPFLFSPCRCHAHFRKALYHQGSQTFSGAAERSKSQPFHFSENYITYVHSRLLSRDRFWLVRILRFVTGFAGAVFSGCTVLYLPPFSQQKTTLQRVVFPSYQPLFIRRRAPRGCAGHSSAFHPAPAGGRKEREYPSCHISSGRFYERAAAQFYPRKGIAEQFP